MASDLVGLTVAGDYHADVRVLIVYGYDLGIVREEGVGILPDIHGDLLYKLLHEGVSSSVNKIGGLMFIGMDKLLQDADIVRSRMFGKNLMHAVLITSNTLGMLEEVLEESPDFRLFDVLFQIFAHRLVIEFNQHIDIFLPEAARFQHPFVVQPRQVVQLVDDVFYFLPVLRRLHQLFVCVAFFIVQVQGHSICSLFSQLQSKVLA